MLRVVEQALETVDRILDLHRNPRLAEDVNHEYGDKYALVDQMTNAAMIGQVNVLGHFGLTAEILKDVDKSKPVTLRFQASDSCTFVKERTVEVPATKTVETDEISESSSPSFFGSKTKSTIKQVVNHVKEFHWKISVDWSVSIYSSSNIEEKKILSSRSSSMILITQTKRAPIPEHRECKPLDVSLNWLIKHIDTGAMTTDFRVDTQSLKTKTPRRNSQVEEALKFMNTFSSWTSGVRAYFNKCVQHDVVDKHNPAGSAPRPNPEDRFTRLRDDTFVPVQPLFEDKTGKQSEAEADASPTATPKSILALPTQTSEDETTLLSKCDVHKLLNEQIRSMNASLESLAKTYSAANITDTLLSVAEASLVLMSMHSERLATFYVSSVGYVEHMLHDQLVAAIGKRIDVSDIEQFLRFHNARLLLPPPKAFCHAIRQPGHYPSGIVSIEAFQNDGKRAPIETLVRKVDCAHSIKLPINAATHVQLTGDIFLHGWIQHRFGPSQNMPELIARARQFSSFMLVVGTMAGYDSFEPKDAIILQNKDELNIPLMLHEIPTAKEFKDAIHSLSPEQQRFAEAFRKMQLGSSVLGISIIQIKPQLEVLLGLPSGALTKEMKLTQDLMELFVEYQVPSDLLSYDGIDDNSNHKDKVNNVRSHVEAVAGVVADAKASELKEQTMKAEMAFHSAVAESPIRATGEHSIAPGVEYWSQGEAISRERDYGAWSGSRPEGAVTRRLKKSKGRTPSSPNMAMMAKASALPLAAMNTSMAEDSSAPPKMPLPASPRDVEVSEKSTHPTPMPSSSGAAPDGAIDFTAVPRLLDSAIDQYAQGSALRSTTVKLSERWSRSRHENLLSEAATSVLRADDIKTERNKAMDLLDALSRSGSLPIAFSELHVMVSVTHCFEKDVIETIVHDNINPIEKLEQSTLLVGSAIHGVPASSLVANGDDLQRLQNFFPSLMHTLP